LATQLKQGIPIDLNYEIIITSPFRKINYFSVLNVTVKENKYKIITLIDAFLHVCFCKPDIAKVTYNFELSKEKSKNANLTEPINLVKSAF